MCSLHATSLAAHPSRGRRRYAHAHGALSQLGKLQLSHNALSDVGFRRLAELLGAGVMGGLRELELEYNHATAEGRRLVKAASRSRGLACHA